MAAELTAERPASALTDTVERVIMLWFPDWSIVAARQAGLLPEDAPVALIERGMVSACCEAAREEGVRAGLRLREAQARCTGLVTAPYDPAVDARLFDEVVEVVENLVPGVQVLRPGLCVVRARGAARYYRGESRAAGELLHGVSPRVVRVGIADGFFTAEQAAYCAGPEQPVFTVPAGQAARFLSSLPIDSLSTDALNTDNPAARSASGGAELVPLLKRLGIRTLGDFAKLELTGVRARFGEAGATAHARAAGRDRRRVVPRVPPKDLDRQVEFEPPLDQVETIAFGFRTAAEAFIAAITAAGLVCTAIRVSAWTESGALAEREWSHPRHFTAAEVLDRVRWQLQGSGGALTSAIAGVRVAPVRVDAIGNHEAGLWGQAPDERIHHGLSRIQSMLGHEAVVTAVTGGGRLLAERRVLVPWGDAAPELAGADRPWPGSLPDPPPATVYAAPPPALVQDAHGLPVTVDRRGIISAPPARLGLPAEGALRRITAWAGPWVLQQRWWDAARQRRAHRLQLLDEHGQAWLVLLEQGGWRVEARYD